MQTALFEMTASAAPAIIGTAAPAAEIVHYENTEGQEAVMTVTPPQEADDMPALPVRMRQGRDGWTVSTNTTYKGQDYDITTSKNYRGVILCSAHAVQRSKSAGFSITEIDVFGGWSAQLAADQGRATEKKLQEVHAKGLEVFRQMIRDGKVKGAPEGLKVGQLLQFRGYQREGMRGIVCHVSGNDVTYIYQGQIHRDKMHHLKPSGESQAIGTYYADEFKPAEVATRYRALVERKLERERLQKEEEERREEEEKREAIQRGAAIVTEVPGWAKASIIGILKEDTSDIQSDYFSHNTVKTLVLGFSRTDRDQFPELKEAAGRCEETKHLQTEGKEHREKYSMGRGYYLAEGWHSGWEVRKAAIESLEYYQEKAGRGEYFAPAAGSESAQERPDAVEVPAGKVQIIDYSERAIAVVGETKPIKDLLKSLGGRFNFRLTCGPGWIFPKTSLERVKAALGSASAKAAPADYVQDPGETYADNFCQANDI